jgi:hypothetical protein
MCFVLQWLYDLDLFYLLELRADTIDIGSGCEPLTYILTNIGVFKLRVHRTYMTLWYRYLIVCCIDEYWRHIKSFSNCKLSIENYIITCSKIVGGRGSAPVPAGEAITLPQTP